MQCVVVGHIEWVQFLPVDRPVAAGAILHSPGGWEEAAGGGGVAAVELARLAGACRLVTALGADPLGQGLPAWFAPHGVEVLGATRPEAHRRAVTLTESDGERTIIVVGPALAARGADGVAVGPADAAYFCKGDPEMVRAARAARVLVATARDLPTLQAAGVVLDALVHSARDPSEEYHPGDLEPAPRLVATSEGARGGRWASADGRSGRWSAAELPGPLVDAYGAGDCFAAGLAYALAEGRSIEVALAFAASRGALAMTRRGSTG